MRTVTTPDGLTHYVMGNADTMCMRRLPEPCDFDEGHTTCFQCFRWLLLYERAYESGRGRGAR